MIVIREEMRQVLEVCVISPTRNEFFFFLIHGFAKCIGYHALEENIKDDLL